MALSSLLGFLDSHGLPLAAPVEGQAALIEIALPPQQWEQVQLFRNGEPLAVSLRRQEGRIRVFADWPPSGPGHYRLVLRRAEQVAESLVTLWPHKISRPAYAHLLEDLQFRLPASIALGLQRAGALASVELLPATQATLAGELLRLRRAVEGWQGKPGLAAALEEVARTPHQVLAMAEEWTPTERARRPLPARLVQAMARGDCLLPNGRPRKVLDTRTELSSDVYENRLLKAFHDQVALRLHRLLPLLEARQDQGPFAEAKRLADRLRCARRQAEILDGAQSLEHPPDRPSMVLLKVPTYRAVLEGWLAFHHSASVRLEEATLDAPLENLPHLYQLWGTLRVLDVLLSVAATAGYRVERQRLVERDATALCLRILPGGEPAVSLHHPQQGMRVDFIPERTYGPQGPLRSITFRQRPDVAIEVWPRSGPPQVYLFDPKYRLASEVGATACQGSPAIAAEAAPKKEDLDKMHAYRDAIRDERYRRVVRYAAILYPGLEVRYEGGIEALRAYPGEEATLVERVERVLAEALAGAS